MALPVHTAEDLSVFDMVIDRLPLLAKTSNNRKLISRYTIEIMHELELCFQIDKDSPDPSLIGDENQYSVVQRSIIADIVSVYILIRTIVKNMGGEASTTTDGSASSGGRVLTKAKAGSAEAEWEQFDIRKGGGLQVSADKLISMYTESALRKGRTLNCLIDICNDCSLAVELLMTRMPHPFRVHVTKDFFINAKVPERN